MPNDLMQQNKRETAQFDSDFTNVFENARDEDALSFAAQFDDNKDVSPPPAESKKIGFEEIGQGIVKQGEAEIDNSMGAGRDIGLGLAHSPRSVARGVTKGVNNVISFVDELNDWVPLPSLIDPKTKKFSPAMRSENSIEEDLGYEIGSPQIPVPGENKTPTVTGGLIEGVSQFLVGLKGTDKIIKSRGAIASVSKGALADMLAFDAHEQRLSDVVQKVPALQNPVAEYFSSNVEDNQVEAKFKQAVEGALTGAIGEAFVQGVRLLKKGKAAAGAFEAEGGKVDDLFDVPDEEKAGLELGAKQFEFLGDAQNQSYLIPEKPSAVSVLPEDKIAIAGTETSGIDVKNISIKSSFLEMPATPPDVGGLVTTLMKDPKTTGSVSIGKFTKDAASFINQQIAKFRPKSNSPIDVSGFEHVIDQNGINHALKKHGVGKETRADQVPITIEDFNKIPEIIAKPDKIEVFASDSAKVPSIEYQKQMDDGTTIVVEVVQNKTKKMTFKTMYKKKGQEGDNVPQKVTHQPQRPESSSTSQRLERPPGKDTIANDSDFVKNGEPERYKINFARIQGPEDIKGLMYEMVNHPTLRDSIETERRGVRDVRATLTAATDIDGFDELMTRRTGDAFNAEHVVAARKVYYDTTSRLMQAAKIAAGPSASQIDQFNFRKMLAVHHAVQKEFMGVRAEAGRALQAWSIPLGGGNGENIRALEQILNEFGGVDASQSLAKRLAGLGNTLNTSQINAITQKGALARTTDALSEAWTLGLLTSPTTHVVNVSSNVLTGLVLGAERLGMAAAKDSPVTLREGGEFFVAMLEAQKDAVKNAAQAFRTGQTGIGMSKLDLPRTRTTARDILDPDGKAGIFSKALDGWGAVLSKYAGGALAAGDEYSKTVLYQAQVRGLAVREGVAQGMEGQVLKKHIADTLANPPSDIRADALTFANYGTFTKELGSIGQSIQRATAKQPLLRFVVPFVRTPINIFKFTYERTPLAPLASKVREDIKAGGARRAAALTKIGMGTTIMAMGADFSQNGLVTGAGPTDPNIRGALRRTGWQPYSVKIGDTYYSYARFEPIATLLGLSADITEIMSNYEAYDIDAQNDVDDLVTAAAIAMGNQVVGKTFLSGFANLAEVLSDPGRYGSGYIDRFAGSVVPAGVAAIERASDPAMEMVFSKMDAIKARIPGASGSIAKRRNIWGDEIKYFYPNEKDIVGASAERLLSLFNPVYYSKEKDAPVDKWMLKNGFSIDMPQKRQAFDGVPIDLREMPKLYERLVTLRGNELVLQRYGNQTMKSFFENLSTEEDPYGRHIGFFMALGNNFDDQQNFINQVVNDYNAAAKEQLIDEHPELLDLINKEKTAAARLQAVRPPAIDRQTQETP